jgi:hypothetical protein
MVILFLIYLVCVILILCQKKMPAYVIALINLVLIVFMFLHHVTDKLNIRL